MKFIPEHIIVSDEIDANGYRGVTLRQFPTKLKGPFRFYTVEGGLQAHPWLDSWPKWWEITGEVRTEKKVNRYRVAYEETIIRITDHRELSENEKLQHFGRVDSVWAQVGA